MKKYLAVAVIVLSGCATNNSGVISTGTDSYFLSRQAGSALRGMANLKAEAIGEASQFCGSKGKSLQILSQKDAEPPYVLGNYPKTEIQFKCA